MLRQVYHPCVLLAKKRYVGFMYESPKQATPTFDAKGIETVRRDTCGAVAKMMERTLRILFTSKDLSQVCTGNEHHTIPWCTLLCCLRSEMCQDFSSACGSLWPLALSALTGLTNQGSDTVAELSDLIWLDRS